MVVIGALPNSVGGGCNPLIPCRPRARGAKAIPHSEDPFASGVKCLRAGVDESAVGTDTPEGAGRWRILKFERHLTTMNAPERMTTEQFSRLRQVFARRSGTLLPDNKKFMLESLLAPRLVDLGLDDFGQYLTLLTTGPYQMEEFHALYSLVRPQEASFFRNQAQLDVFERRVLPELLDQRESTRRLRIWAAACATGEEAYTLAILTHRALGGRHTDWSVEVFGTDLAPQLLEVARTGMYEDAALRNIPDAVRGGYFAKTNGRWRIDDDIRALVSFGVLDLRDTLAARRHGVWDVIFCRDAIVHCDDPTRRKIVNTLSNALADDGTLFIGDAENIRDVTDALRPISVPQGYCYEKSCRAKPRRSIPVAAPAPDPVRGLQREARLIDAGPTDDAADEALEVCVPDDSGRATNLLSPIIASIHNVFSTMFQLPVSVGTPSRREIHGPDRAITGVVEFTGDLTGSIAMHFPQTTATAVVSLFCGHLLDAQSPDFADAIGELVGLVSGGAKSGMADRAVSMSHPVVGPTSPAAEDTGEGAVFIPCRTSRGSFFIEIAVSERPAALV